MTRRTFLAAPALATATPPVRVNAGRLRERIEALSIYGRPEGGSFASGVTRIAYSEADIAARAALMRWMEEAGLEARIDAAGNIFARRDGRENSLAPVLFGSHIDSVPEGGNFDGDLGSLAALEILQRLSEQKMATRRPLEMAVWAGEEAVAFGRSTTGSRMVAGQLASGEMDEVWNGLSKPEALRRIGGDPDRLDQCRRAKGSIHAYLELHIEQGGTLEKAGVPIGVVEGIVSHVRYPVTVRGAANHAGTTPMSDRQDALIAAAQLVLAVNEIAKAEPGAQVGTVGEMHVSPNAPNVVPGEVRLTVELRDLSRAKVLRMGDKVRARAKQIAAATRTSIEIPEREASPEAPAAPEMQKAIEEAALALGLKSRRMPSGAGHDAAPISALAPMGMIFVPSVGGLSHSPKEYTHWRDCAQGADVLLQTVLHFAG